MEGQNIQLHFLDFDTEVTNDIVEVRDGAGPNSTLIGEGVFYPQSSSAEPAHLKTEKFLFGFFSYPHRQRQPRPRLVLNNQSDASVVLHGWFGSRLGV